MALLTHPARSTLLRTRALLPTRRPLSISTLRSALSESDHSRHESENRAGEIEHSKNSQLRNQKDGHGEWKQELSSNSEAAIKADREAVDEDIQTLQKKTVEEVEAEAAQRK